MERFERIRLQSQKNAPALYAFLREIIGIESFSGHEGAVAERIRAEMEKVGFDRVTVDPMGNVLGFMGNGRHLIAMDGHVDTVKYGERAQWNFDPFLGFEDDERIGGLGSTDQKGGLAAAIYAAKTLKDLDLTGDFTLLVSGSVQEEDCDGRCWRYIIEEDGIRPEFAVLTEPSDGLIRNGQRGRMEIKVTTPGVSCHGSMPEKGDNAVYKMTKIISAIERLNAELASDGTLGKGSVTISEIYSTSPSRCAVAGSCSISLDRRLNAAETPAFAIEQLKKLPEVTEAGATVEVYGFDEPSYTGLRFPIENSYPAWVIRPDAPVCQCLADCYRGLFEKEPIITPWMFSTNGVAIMGNHGIPCVGFGPGRVDLAHRPNEETYKKELTDCCAMYASIPLMYVERYAG